MKIIRLFLTVILLMPASIIWSQVPPAAQWYYDEIIASAKRTAKEYRQTTISDQAYVWPEGHWVLVNFLTPGDSTDRKGQNTRAFMAMLNQDDYRAFKDQLANQSRLFEAPIVIAGEKTHNNHPAFGKTIRLSRPVFSADKKIMIVHVRFEIEDQGYEERTRVYVDKQGSWELWGHIYRNGQWCAGSERVIP